MSATAKDSDAKLRLGYVEQDSVVWADGREKLVGRDWKKRKKELWDRADGRCEFVQVRNRCIAEGDDPDHYPNKRWPLRDDRLSNLRLLCRRHHRMTDRRQVGSDRAERRFSASRSEA